ncbi:NAD(P)H-dependent flavin oxidoreductase [Bdellovibrio bacteriovorus]|uniref:2-nitropropane dioxygenase n=1 Tax=Bdellovibrio bacteriovorus str. Tiberius TaxID=1069642 RepID=K7YPN2_BDEBC|nr:nitronate monooxygenase [Bdellovibrio bacteriovorus]AFY01806.1 2-nitropropane dioxygenase [Bdellovibrio bacteriovorus str. Tiberius]
MLKKIKTSFTDTMGIDYPIIAAPMFLVSNTDIVVEASEAGGIGTFPALNYRPIEQYAEALKNIKSRTKKPIGVNVIVNKSNTRQGEDIKVALDHGVDMFITSLGSPKSVIRDAHKNGAKVFCDVTNLEHALKVQDMGADGVIAVGAGAGGHAGPISPLVLIPWLKTRLQIPIIAAGGIAHGSMISACLALGASGVSVGTRFIASREAQVDQSYKDAIVNSTPEDIVMTTRVSGTPAAVINTPYVQKMGTDLPWAMKILKDYKLTKKYMVPLIHLMGMKSLEAAATKPTWKTVWTAGQSVGLVEEILTVKEIYAKLINEYDESVKSLSQLGLD